MEVASDKLIDELYELVVYNPPPKITKHNGAVSVEKVYVEVIKPKQFKATKKRKPSVKPATKKPRKTRRRR